MIKLLLQWRLEIQKAHKENAVPYEIVIPSAIWREFVSAMINECPALEPFDGRTSSKFIMAIGFAFVPSGDCRRARVEAFRQAAAMTRADCYVMADKIERGEA